MRSMACLLYAATTLVACGGASDLVEGGGAGLSGTGATGGSGGVLGGTGGGAVGGTGVTSGGTGGSVASGGTGGSVASGGTGGSVASGGAGGSVTSGGTGGSVASGGAGGSVTSGGAGGSVTSGGAGAGGLSSQEPECPLMKPGDYSMCVGTLMCKYDVDLHCLCADSNCTAIVPACLLNADGSGGSDNADRALPMAGAPAFGVAGSSGVAVPLLWLICTCLESGWYCR